MNNQVEVKDNKVIRAMVCVRFFKDEEDGSVVAYCPALKITTFGKNITEVG